MSQQDKKSEKLAGVVELKKHTNMCIEGLRSSGYPDVYLNLKIYMEISEHPGYGNDLWFKIIVDNKDIPSLRVVVNTAGDKSVGLATGEYFLKVKRHYILSYTQKNIGNLLESIGKNTFFDENEVTLRNTNGGKYWIEVILSKKKKKEKIKIELPHVPCSSLDEILYRIKEGLDQYIKAQNK